MSEHINGATPGMGHNSGMTPEQELEAHSWAQLAASSKRWQDPDYVAHVERVVTLIASAMQGLAELVGPDVVGRLGALNPIERKRVIEASLTLATYKLLADPSLTSKTHLALLQYIAIRSDNEHGRCTDAASTMALFLQVTTQWAEKTLRAMVKTGHLLDAPGNGKTKAHWLPYPKDLLTKNGSSGTTAYVMVDAISGPGNRGGRPKNLVTPQGRGFTNTASGIPLDDQKPHHSECGGINPTNPENPITPTDGGFVPEKNPHHSNLKTPSLGVMTTQTRYTNSEADADDRVPPRVGSIAGATDPDGSSSHLGGPRFAPPPEMAPAPTLLVQEVSAREGSQSEVSEPPPPTPAPVATTCDNIRIVGSSINNYPAHGGMVDGVAEVFVDRRWPAEVTRDYVGINDEMFARWHELSCWRAEDQPPMEIPPPRETTDGELIAVVRSTCHGKSADAVGQALEEALLAAHQKARRGEIKSNPQSYAKEALISILNNREVEKIKQAAKKADAVVLAKVEHEAARAKIEAKAKSDVAIEEMRPDLFEKTAEQNRNIAKTYAEARVSKIGSGKPSAKRDAGGPDERPRDGDTVTKVARSRLAVEGRHVNKLLDEFEGATKLDVIDALEDLDARKQTYEEDNGFVTPENILVVMQRARYIVSRTVVHRTHGTPDKHCPGGVARHDGEPIVTDWFAASEQFIDRLLRDLPGLGIPERADNDPDLEPRQRVCKLVAEAVKIHIAYRERALARKGDAGPANYGGDFREECEAYLVDKLTHRHEAGIKAREAAEKEAAAKAEREAKERADKERLAALEAEVAKRDEIYRAKFGEPTKLDNFQRPMHVNPSTGRFVFSEDVARYGEHPELVIRAQVALKSEILSEPRYPVRERDPKLRWALLTDAEVRERIERARSGLSDNETADTPYDPMKIRTSFVGASWAKPETAPGTPWTWGQSPAASTSPPPASQSSPDPFSNFVPNPHPVLNEARTRRPSKPKGL